MYELIQLTERTYYIKSPTNIGLFRLDEKNVCLIDSGNDKDAGRRIRQVLDANGWQLTAIYNTHANADHIGGNRYLQGQTGCRIYAPGIDCAFTRHPVLEPSFLYGGYPPKDLRHKFLLAQESDAAELTADKLPEGFASIPLPGHFFDMVGFRTPDDVVFLADCLSSREILDKYQIGFIYDVAGYLKTLEQVLEFKARLYESLVGGMLTKEEYASYKAKYTKQAEDIRESVRVLKEKLTEVLENRSERNRWISQFTQFSTLETLDRRALIHMVQSIRVRGKKELDITFTHEDEYKKALQLLALAAQQKDYEQRKVG